MNLGFSTKFPDGSPTYFVEKIWTGFPTSPATWDKRYEKLYYEKFGYPISPISPLPKKHTIRNDPKNRWTAGKHIHFLVHSRSKKRFQFAPVIKVVSTQRIEIIYPEHDGNDRIQRVPYIYVDGRKLTQNQIERLAVNDGFKNLNQFLNWFRTDYTGKIIHWTEIGY